MIQTYDKSLHLTTCKDYIHKILTFGVKEGEILKNFIDNQSNSVAKIARDLEMSRQNIYSLYDTVVFTPEVKERFESYFGKKIFDVKLTNAKESHIETRRKFKEKGESLNGIMVYESAPVYASFKTNYRDDPEHHVPDYVLNIPQFKDCNYGTRASGDSMYPEIRNGDLVICKELPIDARIIFGDIYVVHTKDGLETIKYINQFTDDNSDRQWVLLVPHNKAAGMGTPIPRDEIIKLFKVRAIFKAY